MPDGLSGLFPSRVRLDVAAALLSGPKSFTTPKQLTGAAGIAAHTHAGWARFFHAL